MSSRSGLRLSKKEIAADIIKIRANGKKETNNAKKEAARLKTQQKTSQNAINAQNAHNAHNARHARRKSILRRFSNRVSNTFRRRTHSGRTNLPKTHTPNFNMNNGTNRVNNNGFVIVNPSQSSIRLVNPLTGDTKL